MGDASPRGSSRTSGPTCVGVFWRTSRPPRWPAGARSATKPGSTSEPCPQLLCNLLVGNSLTSSEFRTALANVPDDFELLHQGLIVIHVQEHRSALSVLGQHQRPLRLADLLYEAGGIRPERRERLNIFAGLQ